jgi:hypothetical protein
VGLGTADKWGKGAQECRGRDGNASVDANLREADRQREWTIVKTVLDEMIESVSIDDRRITSRRSSTLRDGRNALTCHSLGIQCLSQTLGQNMM